MRPDTITSMRSSSNTAPETVPATWCTPRLTPDQVAFYHREGYLLPQIPVLPEPVFAGLNALFERLLADWTANGGRPEAMDVPHFYYPELFDFVLHDSVLDLVEPILGPDIAALRRLLDAGYDAPALAGLMEALPDAKAVPAESTLAKEQRRALAAWLDEVHQRLRPA